MNNNLIGYIIILFILGLFVFMIVLNIILIISISRYNKIQESKFELSFAPSDEDFNIIDKLINEEINKYSLLKIEPNNIEYITEDIIIEMEKYILERILYNISPIYLAKLKYIYNPEKLEDMIFEKVQLAVISYSVDVNGSYNQSESV